jgi:hypothetical protein
MGSHRNEWEVAVADPKTRAADPESDRHRPTPKRAPPTPKATGIGAFVPRWDAEGQKQDRPSRPGTAHWAVWSDSVCRSVSVRQEHFHE